MSQLTLAPRCAFFVRTPADRVVSSYVAAMMHFRGELALAPNASFGDFVERLGAAPRSGPASVASPGPERG